MGIKRWIWKRTGIGLTVETYKNIFKERSIVKGTKKTIKEEFCEDNPFTAPIYKEGKYDGKKEGFAEASDMYKEKLIKLADEFLKQKNLIENKIKEYNELLDDYDAEIKMLVDKIDRTENDNAYLRELLARESKLRDMAKKA